MTRRRVTISVDADLAGAAEEAVAAGRATSVSAWVAGAMVDKVARERRLAALAEAVAAYEDEHGPLTDAEVVAQRRADRDAAAATRVVGRRRRGGGAA